MPFTRVLTSFLAVLVLGSACINLPDIESSQDDAGVLIPPRDSGHPPPDGGDKPDASTPTTLTVNLLTPSETVFTNATVDIQVQVTGGTPDRVELLVDDQLLATLEPPYAHQWKTAIAAEGAYQLVARATLAGKSFTSAAQEVVIDRTPPQVVSRAPTPGAEDVWVRQPLVATFSEPIKSNPLTSDAVRLTVGATNVTATIALSEDGKELSVKPSSTTLAPNTVTLTLSSAITDRAGNALAIPPDPWTWKLPAMVPMGTLDAVPERTSANSPILQLDSKGNPVVAWREISSSDGSYENIHTSAWTGTKWQDLGARTSAVASAPTPQIRPEHARAQLALQLDQHDRPITAWINHANASSSGNIVVRRWTGSDWENMGAPLASPQPGGFSRPYSISMQLTSNQTPVMAWELLDTNYQTSIIQTVQWNGSDWESAGTPLPLDFESDGRACPSLALDSFNNPVVAWAEFSPNGMSGIRVRRWTEQGWEDLGPRLEAHPEANTEVATPSLVMQAGETPIVAWREHDGATTNIHVRRWANNAWEPLGGALSALPGTTPTFDPSLQVDIANNIYLMWIESDENGTAKAHIHRWTGSTWAKLGEPVGAPPPQRPLQWSFKPDASGTPFIAMLKMESTGISTVSIGRHNH